MGIDNVLIVYACMSECDVCVCVCVIFDVLLFFHLQQVFRVDSYRKKWIKSGNDFFFTFSCCHDSYEYYVYLFQSVDVLSDGLTVDLCNFQLISRIVLPQVLWVMISVGFRIRNERTKTGICRGKKKKLKKPF